LVYQKIRKPTGIVRLAYLLRQCDFLHRTADNCMLRQMHILYFNGLGEGRMRKREELAISFLKHRDHEVTHGHIDWYSKRPLDSLVREKELQARKLVTTHDRLAIVGSSAGASLAFNTLAALPNAQNVYAVSLCGRIKPGKMPFWDWRTLEVMSYIGDVDESRLFYDSVVQCDKNLDSMDPSRLVRLRIAEQMADFVVPKSTMHDERIATTKIYGIGHGMGIAMAVLALPKIIDSLTEPN